MLGKKRQLQRGDTLIEVLFAITVFALIVVTTLTLINQGISAAQRSLEITLARQQVDGQAETLRFLHDSYVHAYYSGIAFDTSDATSTPAEEFYRILDRVATTDADSASALGSTPCGTPPEGSFVLNTHRAVAMTNSTLFRAPETFPEVQYDGSAVLTSSNGIWIEGIRSNQSTDVRQQNTGYVDFHIRACWAAPGMDEPMNIGTIVRLYEPRG